ncbi:ankyrin repeat family protein [Mycena metata]|uniref:Ankyrin repeat family protein n=1 Tax=Mycena metata TaxID=1033252 RepID=A0AAD7I9G3_9AGAR|nr:ankyrin repeat family protein [Mycena metata]
MASANPAVDLNVLTLNIEAEGHSEHPNFIKILSVQVKHPELGDIVSLDAWRISRAHCAGSFLELMDEDMQEMHDFSVTLFDKLGHVRPHLVDPGHRSGTGCWGREMNSGELLYILDMSVKEPYRNKGLGSWTLLKFLGSEHVEVEDTVVCWPTPVGIRENDVWNSVRSKQIAFFRKNNFRRIGRTGFFGYSPNPDHPSRSIPLDGDVGALDDNRSPISTNFEERQLHFPLHCAIADDKTTTLAATIQSFYDRDPTSIHKADEKGFTPIFVAVSSGNLVATRKLLEWDVRAQLENADNAEGVTPLERLADTMRSTREFSEIFLGWDGYSDVELTIQYLLKQALGQTVDPDLATYITKNKYGCTCGQCAGGWLSPRMRFRLETDAVFWADSMPMNFSSFSKGQALNPSDMMDNPSDFIPPSLHSSFYLSFYKGYCNVLRAIYLLLSTTDEVLSAAGVLRFTENADFFFQKGGRVEFAFDSITHCAQEQSPLGDDTFADTFNDDYPDWASRPTCANDLEFQLVRQKIGLNRMQQWGPYYDFGGGGMDVDDEDDDSDDDY